MKTLLIAAGAALLVGCVSPIQQAAQASTGYLTSLGYTEIKLDTVNRFSCPVGTGRNQAGLSFQARDKGEHVGGIVCTGGDIDGPLPPHHRIDRRWRA